MVHADSWKYKIRREELPAAPHFSDWTEPRLANTYNKTKNGNLNYFQWLHCIGNWGEDHSMCKKMRWYLERTMHEWWLEKWEEKRALGHFDYVTQYGMKPYNGFIPLYQPVKKNRKGAYEFWQDRDFEPLYTDDCQDWKEHAPILHEMFVHGKKPVVE
eukprot:Tbor_TRINITY_DN3480_c0_g1::TRINITY_DN3480_c0_g1_i1::g.3727::m.3727